MKCRCGSEEIHAIVHETSTSRVGIRGWREGTLVLDATDIETGDREDTGRVDVTCDRCGWVDTLRLVPGDIRYTFSSGEWGDDPEGEWTDGDTQATVDALVTNYERVIRANRSPEWDTLRAVADDPPYGETFWEVVEADRGEILAPNPDTLPLETTHPYVFAHLGDALEALKVKLREELTAKSGGELPAGTSEISWSAPAGI